jgi:hypothetical protein
MATQSTQIEDNQGLREILDETADDQRNEFHSTGWWHSINPGDGIILDLANKLENSLPHEKA